MDIFDVVLLGFALSMDAFAVSITNGMCKAGADRKTAFVQSIMFGVFQGMMPLLGFLSGIVFAGLQFLSIPVLLTF